MTTRRAAIGSFNWVDLTVDAAGPVRDSYQQVVGWRSARLDMGGYDDFCMSLRENEMTGAALFQPARSGPRARIDRKTRGAGTAGGRRRRGTAGGPRRRR